MIFTALQPTGYKHIGNYLGAIRHYVELQERGFAMFCIVDLHAMAGGHEPQRLHRLTLDAVALLLASGVDPARSVVFRQSDVNHTQAFWVLSTLVGVAELSGLEHFCLKKGSEGGTASMLLFPVLQAADVLSYSADEVCVGRDQIEHLGLVRCLAQRFNERFGPVLRVPEILTVDAGSEVRDLLNPERKMATSGSPDGALLLMDTDDVIRQKVASALAEAPRIDGSLSDQPGLANLVDMLAALRRVSSASLARSLDGCPAGELKDLVAGEIIAHCGPIRERYANLREDGAALESLIERGAVVAAQRAHETLARVRESVGLRPAPGEWRAMSLA